MSLSCSRSWWLSEEEVGFLVVCEVSVALPRRRKLVGAVRASGGSGAAGGRMESRGFNDAPKTSLEIVQWRVSDKGEIGVQVKAPGTLWGSGEKNGSVYTTVYIEAGIISRSHTDFHHAPLNITSTPPADKALHTRFLSSHLRVFHRFSPTIRPSSIPRLFSLGGFGLQGIGCHSKPPTHPL
jgi:hypothetical protein